MGAEVLSARSAARAQRDAQCEAEQGALRDAVRGQLGGGTDEPAVVWSWQGSEIVLYLDSVEVAVADGQLRVRLDCATDQSGRVVQEIRMALPGADGVATTDLIPDGDERIAARWGSALHDAIWHAVAAS